MEVSERTVQLGGSQLYLLSAKNKSGLFDIIASLGQFRAKVAMNFSIIVKRICTFYNKLQSKDETRQNTPSWET